MDGDGPFKRFAARGQGGRAPAVPMEEVTGPESNSMEAYASLLGRVNSNHPGQGAKNGALALARAESGEAAGRRAGKRPQLLRSSSSSSASSARVRAGRAAAPRSEDAGEQQVAVADLAARFSPSWALPRELTVISDGASDIGAMAWANEIARSSFQYRGMAPSTTKRDDHARLAERLCWFEYPGADMPPAMLTLLARAKLSPADLRHSEFRADGRAEPASAYLGEASFGGGGSADGQTSGSVGTPQPLSRNSSVQDRQFMAASNAAQRRLASTSEGADSARQGGGEDGELSGFLLDRRREWGAALRSLHQLLQGGDCPYFYLIEKESPTSTLAAVFLGAGHGELPVCAMVNKSSKSFRFMLKRCSVDFEAPLNPELCMAEADLDVELQDELAAYSMELNANTTNAAGLQLTRQASLGPSEDESRSLLFFRGAQQVAGLFHVLLNRTVRRAGAHALPRLVSPVLFNHGAAKHVTVGEPSVSVRSGPPVGSKRRLEAVSGEITSVRLSGYVPPHCLAEVISGLHDRAKRRPLVFQLAVDPSTAVFDEALAKLRRQLQRQRLANGSSQTPLAPPLRFSRVSVDHDGNCAIQVPDAASRY